MRSRSGNLPICNPARWRARSWSWTAATTTRLDEVGALLRVARWRARSWSWTAAAAALLDEVGALLHVARRRAQSWSWTAAAAARLDEDRFQLEKTLHTRTHTHTHPFPSRPLPFLPPHASTVTIIPPAAIVNPKGFPLQGFSPRGRRERNTTST